ncbi:MAG: hypothetical protein ACI88H_004275 [Cocleimonas sp.]|jgi:hypothetical protein
MKTLLPFILVLLCSACDSSNNTLNNDQVSKDKVSNSDSKQAIDKPSKEHIGKTVDEYQKMVTEKDKSSNSTEATNATKPVEGEVVSLDQPEIEKGFLPLKWEGLIAPGFDVDSILKKYDPIVSKLEEGSEEANKLYEKMQAEYNKAPPNENLANKKVSIPGFIAPLEAENGIISEFLLVPYFGACIHSPAPPANQTVHVKVASKYGISVEDAYDPIWVSGELLIDKTKTDIGSASYKVEEAKIKKYEVEN